jgi:hypothetical protein
MRTHTHHRTREEATDDQLLCSYEGDCAAGEAHGRGKFSFANGTCYEGKALGF